MHEIVVDEKTGRRKFGGPQPGAGRPRKRSAADEMMKRLEKDDIRNGVVDALFGGTQVKNKTAAHRAAERILQLEHRETELQLKEDAFDDLSKREAIALLAPIFAEFQRRGILPDFDINGSAVEVSRTAMDADTAKWLLGAGSSGNGESGGSGV
jgi:hypothetical protein